MAKSEKSSFQLKILYGEGDAEVVASQAVSIQKAGHQVETAVGRKGIDEAVRRGTFDLVILGPTLTRNDRHHLPYVIKKTQSATRVLVMHTDGDGHPAVDANTDTGRSMADVVAKIASLMAMGRDRFEWTGQRRCGGTVVIFSFLSCQFSVRRPSGRLFVGHRNLIGYESRK